LRNHVGITRQNARYQPRLHDLRHTFAVHRLTAWYQTGADVQRLLLGLCTHLGHISLSGTQRYLTMTPELLAELPRFLEPDTAFSITYVFFRHYFPPCARF
jgi:site-specific recombinase XerD